MKYLIFTLISCMVTGYALFSQNYLEDVLIEIEKNNTTLKALRKRADAEKIGNRMEIYLQNPELELNYLWGNPAVKGNRADVRITQTFDFPTAYAYRNQISDNRISLVELDYQKQMKLILLEARMVCIDLIHANALKSELSSRLVNARTIAESYKLKYETGEVNLLEYNKAQLNALNLSEKVESVDIERYGLISELEYLNGGVPIELNQNSFQWPEIPVDFEQWYLQAEKNNPDLRLLRLETEISQTKEKLNTALSFPKIQAGYMSEKIVDEHFQGLSVGLSIPLWENKNTVKYAKARTFAVQLAETDMKLQYYNEMKALHSKAIGLQTNLDEYRRNIQLFNNANLLKKALDKGELGLIDYFLELSFYYESNDRMLELERDLLKTIAQLNLYL